MCFVHQVLPPVLSCGLVNAVVFVSHGAFMRQFQSNIGGHGNFDIILGPLSRMPQALVSPCMRRHTSYTSIWCPSLLYAVWCLQRDFMTDSRLQVRAAHHLARWMLRRGLLGNGVQPHRAGEVPAAGRHCEDPAEHVVDGTRNHPQRRYAGLLAVLFLREPPSRSSITIPATNANAGEASRGRRRAVGGGNPSANRTLR